MPNKRSRRDRRTVEGDWFGDQGFDLTRLTELVAFPLGHTYRALFSCAIEWMAEELLDAK